MKYWAFLQVLFLVCGLLVACQSRAALVLPTQAQGSDASAQLNGPVLLPTVMDVPSPTSTLLPLSPGSNTSLSPTTDPALVAWQSLPIAPTEISSRLREIYRFGQELGNNPYAFSNIGDCDATPTWFLSDFDLGPQYHSLGGYSNLQAVIDAFHGSFSRQSIAVQRGFTAASVLTPIWADPALCPHNETPLACEVRLHKPVFAFILLGTNDVNHQEVFEAHGARFWII